ncbi:acyl-CoA dehydrogenase family protein [Paenibacillus thiaminolyticus]|uniref:acyl-CoA dehydrogenase family protein n=1 Tax=Paenibacillus thiaminolyticus TaxID=49283 RepID=UPI002350B541|nr:acyl-CoA dehydrogenase [Paenibacillus thiaminolyticus]
MNRSINGCPKWPPVKLSALFALTEPEVGSDAKNVQSSAAASGRKYVINGHKKWITMGQIADIYLVFAQCEGKPTAFLVERNTPGFTATAISGLLGARASMLAELQLADCVIPQDNMVGSVGTGLSHVALHCLDYGRYTVACGCVGLGQACLEQSVDYSRKRRQFGRALRGEPADPEDDHGNDGKCEGSQAVMLSVGVFEGCHGSRFDHGDMDGQIFCLQNG